MDEKEFADRLRRLHGETRAGGPVIQEHEGAGRPGRERTGDAVAKARAFHDRVVRETMAEFVGAVRGAGPRVDDANPKLMTCACEFGDAGRRGTIRIKTRVTGDGAVLVDFFLEPGVYPGRNIVLTSRDIEPSRDEANRAQIREQLIEMYERHLELD